MKEADVINIICKYIQRENWRFWIDNHPTYNDLEFKKHSILISGSRPDIYGYNNVKQIFAVEVKGLTDYKKAIGQALIYKTGVNISFIGGVSSRINNIKDVAVSSGLGLIYVNESQGQVEQIINPIYNIYPYYF